MGRGTAVNLLYGSVERRARARGDAASERVEWMNAHRVEYLRMLGHGHHALLHSLLEARLSERHGADAEVVLHDLQIRKDDVGKETLGGYHEVFHTDSDGVRRCPDGTKDARFEADELFADEWRELIDEEIDRRLGNP